MSATSASKFKTFVNKLIVHTNALWISACSTLELFKVKESHLPSLSFPVSGGMTIPACLPTKMFNDMIDQGEWQKIPFALDTQFCRLRFIREKGDWMGGRKDSQSGMRRRIQYSTRIFLQRKKRETRAFPLIFISEGNNFK